MRENNENRSKQAVSRSRRTARRSGSPASATTTLAICTGRGSTPTRSQTPSGMVSTRCCGRRQQSGAEEWAVFDYEGFGPLRLSEYETVERISRLGRGIAEHGEAFAAFATLPGRQRGRTAAALRGQLPRALGDAPGLRRGLPRRLRHRSTCSTSTYLSRFARTCRSTPKRWPVTWSSKERCWRSRLRRRRRVPVPTPRVSTVVTTFVGGLRLQP